MTTCAMASDAGLLIHPATVAVAGDVPDWMLLFCVVGSAAHDLPGSKRLRLPGILSAHWR